MPWQIVFAPRASRELLTLPRRDQAAVARALDRLAQDPGRVDLKKLEGNEHEWRLRVGRWRVRFVFDRSEHVIHVLHVLPRGEAYR